jgi:uncharacterized BrkB/YihY/UPF0761 family membrane protein
MMKEPITISLQNLEAKHVIVATLLAILLGLFTSMLSDTITDGMMRLLGNKQWPFYVAQGVILAAMLGTVFTILYIVVKPDEPAKPAKPDNDNND